MTAHGNGWPITPNPCCYSSHVFKTYLCSRPDQRWKKHQHCWYDWRLCPRLWFMWSWIKSTVTVLLFPQNISITHGHWGHQDKEPWASPCPFRCGHMWALAHSTTVPLKQNLESMKAGLASPGRSQRWATQLYQGEYRHRLTGHDANTSSQMLCSWPSNNPKGDSKAHRHASACFKVGKLLCFPCLDFHPESGVLYAAAFLLPLPTLSLFCGCHFSTPIFVTTVESLDVPSPAGESVDFTCVVSTSLYSTW